MVGLQTFIMDKLMALIDYRHDEFQKVDDLNLKTSCLCYHCTCCRQSKLTAPWEGDQMCLLGSHQKAVCLCCENEQKCNCRKPDLKECCYQQQAGCCCETQVGCFPGEKFPLSCGICGKELAKLYPK